jgi:hypothetical protein
MVEFVGPWPRKDGHYFTCDFVSSLANSLQEYYIVVPKILRKFGVVWCYGCYDMFMARFPESMSTGMKHGICNFVASLASRLSMLSKVLKKICGDLGVSR